MCKEMGGKLWIQNMFQPIHHSRPESLFSYTGPSGFLGSIAILAPLISYTQQKHQSSHLPFTNKGT